MANRFFGKGGGRGQAGGARFHRAVRVSAKRHVRSPHTDGSAERRPTGRDGPPGRPRGSERSEGTRPSLVSVEQTPASTPYPSQRKETSGVHARTAPQSVALPSAAPGGARFHRADRVSAKRHVRSPHAHGSAEPYRRPTLTDWCKRPSRVWDAFVPFADASPGLANTKGRISWLCLLAYSLHPRRNDCWSRISHSPFHYGRPSLMNVSPSQWSWRLAVLVGMLSLGCLGAETPVSTGSAQKIEVQGRQMQFEARGKGRPTLVIETGLGESGPRFAVPQQPHLPIRPGRTGWK